MNWTDFKEAAKYIGIPGAMALALVYAFVKGWLITRREFDAAIKDRDEWRELALKNWQTTDRLSGTTQQLADHVTAAGNNVK